MPAPHSLRPTYSRALVARLDYHNPIAAQYSVCDHCEQLMYEADALALWGETPVADQIAIRWDAARARIARVADADQLRRIDAEFAELPF